MTAHLTDAAAHALTLAHPEAAAVSGGWDNGWHEPGNAWVAGSYGTAWVTLEHGRVVLESGTGLVRLTAAQATALAAALTEFAALAN